VGKMNKIAMYNDVTWRVRVSIFALEKQQYILPVLLSYMSLSAVLKQWVSYNNAFIANLNRQYT
jgi:hypothetical protein